MSCGCPRLPGRFMVVSVGVLAGLFVAPSEALAFKRDRTLLPAAVRTPAHSSVTSHIASGAGNAAFHMLLGLAVVSALIFGLYKILKRTSAKNDKTAPDDGWMQVVSTTPLGPSRALHLVRVGNEVVLLAASEQSVTPVRIYGAEEAERLGVNAMPIEIGPGRRVRVNPGVGSALIETLKRYTAR